MERNEWLDLKQVAAAPLVKLLTQLGDVSNVTPSQRRRHDQHEDALANSTCAEQPQHVMEARPRVPPQLPEGGLEVKVATAEKKESRQKCSKQL